MYKMQRIIVAFVSVIGTLGGYFVLVMSLAYMKDDPVNQFYVGWLGGSVAGISELGLVLVMDKSLWAKPSKLSYWQQPSAPPMPDE